MMFETQSGDEVAAAAASDFIRERDEKLWTVESDGSLRSPSTDLTIQTPLFRGGEARILRGVFQGKDVLVKAFTRPMPREKIDVLESRLNIEEKESFARAVYVNPETRLVRIVLEDKGQNLLVYILRGFCTISAMERAQNSLIICQALMRRIHAYHSKGLVHGDIKPDNIALGKPLADSRIMISDESVVLLDREGILEVDAVVRTCTPGYKEFHEGKSAHIASYFSDRHALAIIIAILIEGSVCQDFTKGLSILKKIKSLNQDLPNFLGTSKAKIAPFYSEFYQVVAPFIINLKEKLTALSFSSMLEKQLIGLGQIAELLLDDHNSMIPLSQHLPKFAALLAEPVAEATASVSLPAAARSPEAVPSERPVPLVDEACVARRTRSGIKRVRPGGILSPIPGNLPFLGHAITAHERATGGAPSIGGGGVF